jgi:hypothetical protein
MHMAIAAWITALGAIFAAGFAYGIISMYEWTAAAWARRKVQTTSSDGGSLNEQPSPEQRAAHR